MADIAIQYPPSAVFVKDITHIRSQLAGATAPTQGQAVYLDPTTGTVLATNAATAGKFQGRGIVVSRGGPGNALDVVESGYVAGFDLTALAFDALVYYSDTAGALSTTAGTNSSIAGRVAAMSDRDPVTGKPSKVLYFRPSAV